MMKRSLLVCLLALSACPPGSNGLGLLKQGFLERSNVDLSAELVALQVLESKRAALLEVMRSYGIEMP